VFWLVAYFGLVSKRAANTTSATASDTRKTVACILCRHYVALLSCKLTLPDGTIDHLCWSALGIRSFPADHRKPNGREKMMKQNKIISLAIIGLVLGGIVGAMVDSEQANTATLAVVGGVIGFLAGWVWNSRSGGSEDSGSGGSEDSGSGGSEG
jgi:F0F1-type ATP synthase assembly protein I